MAKVLPILLALAPTLFGEGNNPQHIPQDIWNTTIGDQKNISIFSPPTIKDKMSLYGYGYRYPRAHRKTIELAYPKEYARAAIYNKGVAANNTWVQFLKFHGYYDQIRDILQKASQEYREAGIAKKYTPEKAEELKQAKLRKLYAQAQALSQFRNEYKTTYPSKYNEGLTFDEAMYEIAYKMDNEFEKLGQGRPFGTNKAVPPVRRPPKWFKGKAQSLPTKIEED